MIASIVKPSKTIHLSRSEIKVLLVDDDTFQLEFISEIFHSLGLLNITTASSGEQALQKMANNPSSFNLLVIDLYMPGMDGFQFMESVVRMGFSGALIIVSGQTEEVMHAASMVAQLRRFTLLGSVPKPVSRAALSGLISRLA